MRKTPLQLHGLNKRLKTRAGVTMILIMLVLPALIAMAAMAINLAYIQSVNTKAQFIADAASRAAGRAYVEGGSSAESRVAALTAAQRIATLNPIDSVVIPIAASDLEFGTSQRTAGDTAFQFVAGTSGNAVRVSTTSFADGGQTSPKLVFPVFGGTSNADIRPSVSAINTQMTLDIALVVDRSGSMAWAANSADANVPYSTGGPVPANSRWQALDAAVNLFLTELESTATNEKVSLSSYASDCRIDNDLLFDFDVTRNNMTSITNAYYGGSTNIGSGIVNGMATLNDTATARDWSVRVLILLSDGVNYQGPDPLTEAAKAQAQGIPIYTISFSAEADEVLMGEIATSTGGNHHHAEGDAELMEAFRAIAHSMPSLLTH